MKTLIRWFASLPLSKRVLVVNFPLMCLWALMFAFHLGSYLRLPNIPLQTLQQRQVWELTIAVAGAAGTILLNVWLARLPFASLKDLARTMDEVAAGNLYLRARKGLPHEELLGGIIRSFNVMLDKLETERQRSRSLANLVMVAQEEERKRIARDVHDQSCQVLAAVAIHAQHLQQKILASPDRARAEEYVEELGQIEALTRQVLKELKHLAFNLRPSLLEEMGLRRALGWLFMEALEDRGIHLEFKFEGLEIRFPEQIEIPLYRIAQEALANVVKHSMARNVTVSLTLTPELIKLVISDDGRGFVPESLSHAGDQFIGVQGMKERAELVSGELALDSSPGSGTTITVTVPVPSARIEGLPA